MKQRQLTPRHNHTASHTRSHATGRTGSARAPGQVLLSHAFAVGQPTADAATEARVTLALAEAQFRLHDGRVAQQAASCLLTPQCGDTVALLRTPSGLFLTHVLLRAPQPIESTTAGRAQISVPGAHALVLQQAAVELVATQHLALRCGGDMELTSVSGAVSLNARHFLSCVSETLVQTAQHWVTRVEQGVLQASQLLRLHGQQALFTADADMKIDAERVSLG